MKGTGKFNIKRGTEIHLCPARTAGFLLSFKRSLEEIIPIGVRW